MDINLIVNLGRRAWCLEILSLMNAGVPGRQAVLLARTGAGRTAFRQSLDHLCEAGLVERNPGHGHPLRPEFRLTADGIAAAGLAAAVLDATPRADQDVLRKSWTLPVLGTLAQPRRFNEIKRDLPPITDRALSQSLKLLETRAWLRRDVDVAARPPAPRYVPIQTGRQVGTLLQRALSG